MFAMHYICRHVDLACPVRTDILLMKHDFGFLLSFRNEIYEA